MHLGLYKGPEPVVLPEFLGLSRRKWLDAYQDAKLRVIEIRNLRLSILWKIPEDPLDLCCLGSRVWGLGFRI